MGQTYQVLPRASETVSVIVDGRPLRAKLGESLLTVLLSHFHHIRRNEPNGEPRAGFCLMGVCQDCWVWLSAGRRVRACATAVTQGMEIFTREPEAWHE